MVDRLRSSSERIVFESVVSGDCFHSAIDTYTDLSRQYPNQRKDIKLVHAMVTGQGPIEGKRHGHAFVEFNDTIFDRSNGRKLILPKSMYYKLGKVREGVRGQHHVYSRTEFNKKMLDHGTYGPWDLDKDDL